MAQVIPETWSVPDRFKQRIGARGGRQRAMVDSGHLLLLLHELPGEVDAERSAKLFWRQPSGEWKATGSKGNGLNALKAHLEAFRDSIQDLDERIDQAPNADRLYQILRALTPLARSARNMHRALQEAREGVEDKDVISMRDFAGDIERAGELAVGDAQNALEYIETKAAEEQTVLARKAGEAQHRLNLIAALFFPATALGSILGTNMHSGLEGRDPWIYWAVVAFAFGVGFIVRSTVNK